MNFVKSYGLQVIICLFMFARWPIPHQCSLGSTLGVNVVQCLPMTCVPVLVLCFCACFLPVCGCQRIFRHLHFKPVCYAACQVHIHRLGGVAFTDCSPTQYLIAVDTAYFHWSGPMPRSLYLEAIIHMHGYWTAKFCGYCLEYDHYIVVKLRDFQTSSRTGH